MKLIEVSVHVITCYPGHIWIRDGSPSTHLDKGIIERKPVKQIKSSGVCSILDQKILDLGERFKISSCGVDSVMQRSTLLLI